MDCLHWDPLYSIQEVLQGWGGCGGIEVRGGAGSKGLGLSLSPLYIFDKLQIQGLSLAIRCMGNMVSSVGIQ